jgi:hypothetical protein
MNQARYSFGVVTVEGKIYAIGGLYDTGILDTNECYDPVIDTWVTLEPMPTVRQDFAIAVYDGKIYCIGGFIIDTSNPSYYEHPHRVDFSVNEVYDPTTNSWSTKAPMPVSKPSLQAHVVDGKIFVIAKDDGNLFRYDPATDKWAKQASVSISKYSNGSNGYLGFSTILDNKIIVLLYKWGYSSKFLIYNPKTDKWSDKNAPSFMAESSNSSEPVRGRGIIGTTSGVYAPQKVYVFSTNIYGSTSNEIPVYDPISNTWSAAKGIPTNRSYFGVAVVDDIFYVIGGFIDDSSAQACATNEQYIPIGYQSTPITPKPTAPSLQT